MVLGSPTTPPSPESLIRCESRYLREQRERTASRSPALPEPSRLAKVATPPRVILKDRTIRLAGIASKLAAIRARIAHLARFMVALSSAL
jgi:hypothetical protein